MSGSILVNSLRNLYEEAFRKPFYSTHASQNCRTLKSVPGIRCGMRSYTGIPKRSKYTAIISPYSPPFMDGWMDGWTDGWMDGWMDEMDGWTCGCMDVRMDVWMYVSVLERVKRVMYVCMHACMHACRYVPNSGKWASGTSQESEGSQQAPHQGARGEG